MTTDSPAADTHGDTESDGWDRLASDVVALGPGNATEGLSEPEETRQGRALLHGEKYGPLARGRVIA